MWQAFNEFSDFVLSPTDEEEGAILTATDHNGGESLLENSPPNNKLLDNDGMGNQFATKVGGDGSSGALNHSSDVDEDNDSSIEDSTTTNDKNVSSDDDNERGIFYNMGGGDFNDILLFRNGESDDDENDNVEMSPEMEAARRCELEETFIEPLLIVDDDDSSSSDHGSVGSSDKAKASIANENSSDNDSENSVSGDDSSNDGEGEEDEESMDEDAMEQKEIQQFLDTFDIEACTQQISQLLSTNEDDDTPAATLTPLQQHFQTLVPQTVSYSDFWTRYYYRCDPHRIARQWEHQDHLDHLHNLKQQQMRDQALSEMSTAAINITRSAASFLNKGLLWSGAAAEEALTGVGDIVDAVEEAATSLRVHQSKGRPPFVMAAVEDDDDSYYEEEDDEEEIELEEEDCGEEGGLGWNSDEEDDEDEEDGFGDVDEDEEVTFLDVSLVSNDDDEGQAAPTSPLLKLESLDVIKSRQSLMQAEERRNTMMQMVEERNEEIIQLQFALEQGQQQQCPPSSVSSDSIHDLKREVEWLTHLIAASSTTANDSHRQKDTSINALKSILHQMKNDLLHCQKMKVAGESIKASEAIIQDLQSKIQVIKANHSNNLPKMDTHSSKQAHLQEQLNQTKDKCNHLRSETDKTNQCIIQCQARLQELRKGQRKQAEEQARQLEQVVVAAQTGASLV